MSSIMDIIAHETGGRMDTIHGLRGHFMNNIDAKPPGNNRKIINRFFIGITVVLLVIVIGAIVLFWNELRTLFSLEKIDDYGAYQMTYYGDYGFEEFLEVGASSDEEIEEFVTKRLLKGLPINLGVTGDGCTAFVTKNEKGEVIYGRNFDFLYAPSLQLYTKPKNGYKSVSTVNLSFAGYSENFLPDDSILDKFLTLAAPFLPFDGMNEKGVAIALLAVPEAEPSYDSNKITLNTTTAIRLVLDHASTVEEAVQLLRNYNIYFSGDIECHYLIADASGRSVIVEFYDDALQVVETKTDYQVATNFIAYNGLNIGEGFTEFERYDMVEKELLDNNGILSENDVISILAKVGVQDGEVDKLQWSVVYNLTTGDVRLFIHRDTNDITATKLEMSN